MARDHCHHHHHHHHTSGTSSNNNTSNNNSNGNSRRHRIPNPPVPHAQPSLLQIVPPTTRVSASAPAPAPASNTDRNGNKIHQHRRRTTTNRHEQYGQKSAPENNSNTDVQELSVEDPEAMDAKKGLNEWGAFGGGGTGGVGGTGPFGFGPLLFHHHGSSGSGEGDIGGSSEDEKTPSTSTASRDPFEMDQLMMGDPISFNPLQAISWAKLDEEPMEEDNDVDMIEGERKPPRTFDNDVEGDRYFEYSPKQATGDTSHFQQVSYGEHSGHNADGSPTSTSSTGMSTEVARRATRNSPYAKYPEHSPTANVSQTRSAVNLSSQTPEPTDVYSNNNNGVVPVVPPPPPPPPPPGRVSEQKAPSSTGSRQRRQRHRQPRETKKSGPQPVTTVPTSHPYPGDPYQRQEYAFQPPPPPPSFPSSLPPQYHQSSAVFQPELQYHQQQQTTLPHPAYGGYAITESYPPHLPPGQEQQQQFLLCLAPHCNVRFGCESELNAHYRAEHSFICNWASCKSASFTSNNALVWHVKAEHLLLCPVPGCCDRVFSNKKALDGHVRVN